MIRNRLLWSLLTPITNCGFYPQSVPVPSRSVHAMNSPGKETSHTLFSLLELGLGHPQGITLNLSEDNPGSDTQPVLGI